MTVQSVDILGREMTNTGVFGADLVQELVTRAQVLSL